MSQKLHPLQAMLEEFGIEVRSYSGRAMYGKECLGVDIDRSGLGEFISNVIEATQSQVGAENIDEISEAFRGMRTDSMGLGQIVYFPNVPFVGEDEPDDE